ncbi:hypothetical protein PspR76_05900 [Pseudomonas sp. R76]|nr:hypothetical protein PspR76_05900 [Pseudomonas sp. R76]
MALLLVLALKCSRPSWEKGLAPVPQSVDRGIKPLNINALGFLTDPLGEAEPWPFSGWQFILVAALN